MLLGVVAVAANRSSDVAAEGAHETPGSWVSLEPQILVSSHHWTSLIQITHRGQREVTTQKLRKTYCRRNLLWDSVGWTAPRSSSNEDGLREGEGVGIGGDASARISRPVHHLRPKSRCCFQTSAGHPRARDGGTR